MGAGAIPIANDAIKSKYPDFGYPSHGEPFSFEQSAAHNHFCP